MSLARQLATTERITHIGSWSWDRASGVVRWSDELYRIYGLVPQSRALTYEHFLSLVHPEDRERVAAAVRDAVEQHTVFTYRERILRPDGSVRQLDTTGEPQYAEDGTLIGLVGSCRDVTDEVRHAERLRLFADIVDDMQVGFSVWRLDDYDQPPSLRLVASNHASEVKTGISNVASVGHTLEDCFPAAVGTELPRVMREVEAAQVRQELAAFRIPGRACVFAVKVVPLPERCVGLALEDITDRVRGGHVHRGERRALEMLAAGAELELILTALLDVIEELEPGTIAAVKVLDQSGTRLRGAAMRSLPPSLAVASEGTPVGPLAGACGAAVYRRAPVFVADDPDDPLVAQFLPIATPLGLKSCWTLPILANAGHVVGTFALYRTHVQPPEPSLMELTTRVAHVAGIAIERRQLDGQLAALSARVEAAREDERTGIAREIHDVLGQALTALKLDLAWLDRRRADPAVVGDKLRAMSQSVDELIQAVQRISSELRPGILDDLGLQAAIEWQAAQIQQRSNLTIAVHSDLGDVRLEHGLATASFRIFQEALTNVVRHASATTVTVELGLERGRLRMVILDDGVGISEPAGRARGLGLLGMAERARRLDGECSIGRREPAGTAVTVSLPLRFPADPPSGLQPAISSART